MENTIAESATAESAIAWTLSTGTKQQRLSFSTLDLLHSCERLFQLERLLAGEREAESDHLLFGSAYGTGVASYLEHQDEDRALYEAWLAYWPELDSDKKSVWRCLQALIKSFSSLDNLLDEYELVSFQSRSATELSFRLNIDQDHYYVGYIDAVLQHKYSKQYVVFECKTTGLALYDLSPLYKHSGQALGYSIVLDKIVGEAQSSYGVLYFACQLGRGFSDITCHVMPFNKTLLDRLNWFIVLGLDVKHLQEMKSLQVYPRRHQSCLRFNRPCRHFGTCHMHSLDRPKVLEEDETAYQFIYELEDVIEDHLSRIAGEAAQPQEDFSVNDQTIQDSAFVLGEIVDLDTFQAPVVQAEAVASSKQKLSDILAARKRKGV